jgi:hypothetical protein
MLNIKIGAKNTFYHVLQLQDCLLEVLSIACTDVLVKTGKKTPVSGF